MDRIYFFHNGKECKIGCTENDLRRRLWAAHVWSPNALEIIGWINVETGMKYIEEKAIHLSLAHRRLVKPSGNGEWFAITKAETLNIINTYEGTKNDYNYGTASRHPAHNVRPLCGRQQNQTASDGEVLHNSFGVFSNSNPKRLLTSRGTKHALGSEAFLRKAGA